MRDAYRGASCCDHLDDLQGKDAACPKGCGRDEMTFPDAVQYVVEALASASFEPSTVTYDFVAGAMDTGVCLLYDAGSPQDDNSFNTGASIGFEKAVTEFGHLVSYRAVYDTTIPKRAAAQAVVGALTSSEFDPLKINTTIADAVTGTNREHITRKASSVCDSMIGIGFSFEVMATIATSFPHASYTVIDPTPFMTPRSNVRAARFAVQEGTFLTGAAAALQSQTGHVCFLAAIPLPNVIVPFVAGFLDGAEAVNSTITTSVAYLNPSNPYDTPQFGNVTGAYDVAMSMYESGCDVIEQAAGPAGAGVFQAAVDYRTAHPNAPPAWAIGVDVDQWVIFEDHRDVILTSVLKRVDTAVYDTFKAQAESGTVTGDMTYTLANGGIGYATSGDYLTNETIDALEEYKAAIVNGSIVPSSGRTE